MAIRKTRKRYEIPGHARYLTFSCFRRRPFFDDHWARGVFADRLSAARSSVGFRLYAWVVMPEHVHLLIRPDLPEVDVPRVLMAVKRPVAYTVRRTWRDAGEELPERFWQAGGGYDRNVFTDREVREKIEYIHTNPVRRGLVDRPPQWAWSSARAWAKLETAWPVINRLSE